MDINTNTENRLEGLNPTNDIVDVKNTDQKEPQIQNNETINSIKEEEAEIQIISEKNDPTIQIQANSGQINNNENQKNKHGDIGSETSSSEDEEDEEDEESKLTEEELKQMEEEKQQINQQLKEEGIEVEKEKGQIQNQIEQQFQVTQHSCQICKKIGNLFRCSRCKLIYYCSQDCQKEDWKYHKTICKPEQVSQPVQQIQATPPPEKKGKSLDDFKDLKFVGQGNFSEIFSAIDIKDGLKYAIKKINKRRLSQVNKEKDILMEKHCLSRLLNNPYVTRLYATFQDDDHLYIQTELVEGGELWNEIHVFGAIAQSLIKYYFSQIILAIKSIHEIGIIHRDIKSENILLTPEKKIKFIDFGTARDMQNQNITGSGNGMKGKRVYEHFVGTPQFMAPECIRNRDSTYKSDIYSLGCLFYQLICGQTPYTGKTDYLVFTAALETELKFPTNWPFTEEQKDLIGKMLQKQLQNRIDLQQVMQHPYWGEGWDWNNVPDYETCLSQVTEEEKFYIETRDKMKEVEKEETRDEKEFHLDYIIKEQKKKVQSGDKQFSYMERLAREHLLVVDEENKFQ